MKSGRGIYYYQDGSKYEGDWYQDDKDGYGTLESGNGDKYVGEWKIG